MKKYWWKILTVLLLGYVIIAGMLMKVPRIPKLNESARNLFYHVPMWYAMIVLFLVSCIHGIKYLRKGDLVQDAISHEYVKVGIVFGCLGMLTGMEWASVAWGSPWSNDPKQVGSALCLLTYLAYQVLRSSIPDIDKRAKVAAVYNIFSFALIIPLIFIIPGFSKSLHPGTEGKPFEALYSQASVLRKVSVPAMFAWTMLGLWLANLKVRIRKIEIAKRWS